MIEVEVVLAWPQQVLSRRLKLEEGATVADAIAAAALEGSADCPAAAVHGVLARPQQVLLDGDRVELLRNGRRESLTFPRQQSGQYSYTPPAENSPDDSLQQLDQLDQDNLEQLRQRMQELREQMEASGTPPEETPAEQPMESD